MLTAYLKYICGIDIIFMTNEMTRQRAMIRKDTSNLLAPDIILLTELKE